MTREEAIRIIQNEYKCVDRECDIEKSCGKCPYMMPTKEPILKAYKMAIKALEQNESAEEWYKLFVEKLDEQKPCEKSMNKEYTFGKNKGVGVYWNEQTDTVELPEAVFRYILSLVPTEEIEQEPCDDAISREAVIEATHHCGDLQEVRGVVQQLPSVTQKSETVTEFADRCRECGAKYGKLLEQKSGKWIDREVYDADRWKCSACGRTEPYREDYCPNCGAKMLLKDICK